MGSFKALDFEELFQGTLAIQWEDIIPVNGKIHVTGKSVKSKLFSVPDCQAIVKKSIVESMKRKYKQEWFEEDGPVYKIEVSLLNDNVTLTLDTSGPGLHKRGYRSQQGEAPLKETLAAAMVNLSRWKPDRPFADPFCGSGTIAIEAAMLAKNIAPGLKRSFVSEEWPIIPQNLWSRYREEAHDLITNPEVEIYASDYDKRVFDYAQENARAAGVSDLILFEKKPFSEFSSRKKFGCIVTNPPYGERMNSDNSMGDLYREMGRVFTRLDSWSYFIITSFEEFEKYFGKKADKNRKLFNGKIKSYFYQYLGELPERKKSDRINES
jgi:putative N6-adenine-specific DNA methylase